MAYYDICIEKFFKFENCRKRWCKYHDTHYADVVEVDNEKSKYLYHNNEIAVLNNRYLIISDCGYQTQTTIKRLNVILKKAREIYKIFDCSVSLCCSGKIGSTDVECFMTKFEVHNSKKWYLMSTYYSPTSLFSSYYETPVTIDIVNNKIVNENDLTEVTYIKKWYKRKSILKDVYNREYIKFYDDDNKYAIRIRDCKIFMKMENDTIKSNYAKEIKKYDFIKEINNIGDLLNIIKELDKKKFVEIISEV